MKSIKECEHLGEYVKAQFKVVQRIVRLQPEYQLLKTEEEQKSYIRPYFTKYIEIHGENNREWYCGFICKDRYKCELAEKYLKPISESDYIDSKNKA